jgi:hypothetical protein
VDPDDAERLVDGMERARDLLGLNVEPPSRELQSRVFRAALDQRVGVTWSQRVGEGGRVEAVAIVETKRGTIARPVTSTWEEAWRATGLLD